MPLNKKTIGIIKVWHLILLVIIASASIVGYILHKKGQRDRCQAYLKTSEDELSRDNFDKALEHLKTARSYCDDKDVEARVLTVETLKVAANYDQVRLVKDNSILTTTNENLRLIRNYSGETAELRVLQGILEELSDRPGKSLEQYDLAIRQKPSYASAYNSWGHTIFKWKLGGSGWSDKALEKFKRAAELKPDYAWPYLNTAAVHLELAENALNSAKPDLDGAKNHLPTTKESLEKAEKLLPDTPRVYILWGHYHVIQARIFSGRGLKLEANQSYYKAINSLQESKHKNEKIADARVLLGSVYLELGMLVEALHELEMAVSLDDMNIVACARLVYCLSRQATLNEQTNNEVAAQVKRGLGLIEQFRQKFTARSLETNDPDAREWLATAVKDYEPIEKDLKAFDQEQSQTEHEYNYKRK